MKPTLDRRLGRFVAGMLLAGALAALSPAVSAGQAGTFGKGAGYAYGWPVKPFFAQHPVRGYFADPRIGKSRRTGELIKSLHFGVDVAALDGTPVYAALTGRVYVSTRHQNVVQVRGSNGVEFEYWHVVPTVPSGTWAVAYETMIGRIKAPWGHVHFAERRNGVFVNPLRRGAMGPYADATSPTVLGVRLARVSGGGRPVSPGTAWDIILEAFDMPALRVPYTGWSDLPVTPALVRWRIVGPGGRPVLRWLTAFDARFALPSASFYDVYADGTRQNHRNEPGSYRFYLARDWSSAGVAPGTYAIQVVASDTRGNSVRHRHAFTIIRRP